MRVQQVERPALQAPSLIWSQLWQLAAMCPKAMATKQGLETAVVPG